ncbi:MAG TPA: PQQ-dependent sugar dehydrogenase [Thermoanaerobaculia bacterium]|nr:PQQ-dependent sugar dehydrogenase [Thermoanaerobaculia bacterium]
MRPLLIILTLLLLPIRTGAELLRGFYTEGVIPAQGFVTSLAVDAAGRLHYTTGDGGVYRVEDSESILVAFVETAFEGNMALLGMNFAPDGAIVVHSVSPDKSADVISTVDPNTGEITETARFYCARNCPTEHHGGNPIVAPDGSIYVAIGDLGVPTTAQRHDLPGGKLFRITPEGAVFKLARGLRNPYDLAWDGAGHRIIFTDNGVQGGDELNFYPLDAEEELDYGWPNTMGDAPPAADSVAPVYVFPSTIAPTGMWLLTGNTRILRKGLLVAGFVTGSIDYFPSLDLPIGAPIRLVEGTERVMDVVETRSGEIYYATISAIRRLQIPMPGDANGDGVVNLDDLAALAAEITDGDGDVTFEAQKGQYPGCWGADVNEDGRIDWADYSALTYMLGGRMRGARR